MTRENQHDWNGCKCKKCDNSRNEQHEWNGCKCDVCGRRKHELNLELTKCKHCGMITGVSRNIINAKYIEHFFYEVNMSIKVGIFSSFNYDFGIKMSNEGAMRKLKDGLSDMRRFSGACDMELLYINPESYLHEIISFLNNKKNWDSPKINQIINSANDDLAIIKKDNMHASWNGLFFNEIKI